MANENKCARCGGSLDSGYYTSKTGYLCANCGKALGWEGKQPLRYLNNGGQGQNAFGVQDNSFGNSSGVSTGNPFEAQNNAFGGQSGGAFGGQANSPFGGGGSAPTNPFSQQFTQDGQANMAQATSTNSTNPFTQSSMQVNTGQMQQSVTAPTAQQPVNSGAVPTYNRPPEKKSGGKFPIIIPIIAVVVVLIIVLVVIVGGKGGEDTEQPTGSEVVSESVVEGDTTGEVTGEPEVTLITASPETSFEETEVKEANSDDPQILDFAN